MKNKHNIQLKRNSKIHKVKRYRNMKIPKTKHIYIARTQHIKTQKTDTQLNVTNINQKSTE